VSIEKIINISVFTGNSIKNLKKANIEVVNAVTYLRYKNIITEQIKFLAALIILKKGESITVILHLIYRVSK